MASHKDLCLHALTLLKGHISVATPKQLPQFTKDLELFTSLHTFLESDNTSKKGPGGYWKTFRETQEFEIDTRGEGPVVVLGIDNVAKAINRKVSWVRQKLAHGHGTFSHLYDEKIMTITRLTTHGGE